LIGPNLKNAAIRLVKNFRVGLSVIISQESENKLKIIRELENYFQFILTLEGYSEDYFFMSTKSKIQKKKKLYYRTESFFVHFQQLMTLTVKLKNTLSLKKN
jgi:hypothetical protein